MNQKLSAKLFTTIITICLILSVFPASTVFATAEPELKTEGNFEYYINKNKAVISDYTGKEKKLVIPSALGGYSVTSIGDGAFNYSKTLTSVTIGDNITSVGEDAFSNCNSLTKITIGNCVKSIGEYVFSGCDSLTNINVSNKNANYKAIDGVLFTKDGTKLIVYPEGKQNNKYTVPKSIKSIGVYAFAGNNNITGITLSKGVTSIGDDAFYGCEFLANVTIPNTVTSIGDDAFSYCLSLAGITIPNSVISIGKYSFHFCELLENVKIPDSVKSIGDEAFSNCESLKSITIGKSFKSMGKGIFLYCKNLTDINISTGNSVYKSIKGVLFTKNGTKLITYPEGRKNSSYTIPDGVTVIADSAFCYCEHLNNVTFPDSMISIGSSAFSDCSSLSEIVLPNGLTSVGDCAFSNCKSLLKVTIPDSVTSIDFMSFGYYYISATYFYNTIEYFTIIGNKGTAAEAYATTHNFRFLLPDDPAVNIPITKSDLYPSDDDDDIFDDYEDYVDDYEDYVDVYPIPTSTPVETVTGTNCVSSQNSGKVTTPDTVVSTKTKAQINATKDGNKSPQTGDNSDVPVFAFAMLVCVCITTTLLISKRKHR